MAFVIIMWLAAPLTLLERRTAATNPSLASWAALAQLVLWQLGILTYRGAVSMTMMLLSSTVKMLWQNAASLPYLLEQMKLIKVVLLGPDQALQNASGMLHKPVAKPYMPH
jgi:hypothetical protein